MNKHWWDVSMCFLQLSLLWDHDLRREGDSRHLWGAEGVTAPYLVNIQDNQWLLISKIINTQDNQRWEMIRPQWHPLLWTFSWLTHLYLLMTGQSFPLLPLKIQHCLWFPSILIATESPGNCRDRSGLRLLGLVLTPKVLSLLKYISYSSYSWLIFNFNSLYCHFAPSLGLSTLQFFRDRLWLNQYLQLRCFCNMLIAQSGCKK